MRVIIFSFAISCFIHLIYFTGTIIYGYIQTKKYLPTISNSYENIDYLQNDVAFGYVFHPSLLIYTLLGIALLSGVIIWLFQKRQLFLSNK